MFADLRHRITKARVELSNHLREGAHKVEEEIHAVVEEKKHPSYRTLLTKYSKARLIKRLKEIDKNLIDTVRVIPLRIKITMLDGIILRFWSDGSLRHTLGKEDRRKFRRQQRRERWRQWVASQQP